MKNFQTISIYGIILGLVTYTVYDKKINQSLYDEQYRDGSWHQIQIIDFQAHENLYFAGERVPIENKAIRQRLDKEFYSFIFAPTNTALLIQKAKFWLPCFEKILIETGVHTDLKYLPIIESELIPQAISPKGAGGMWQIMPEVAQKYGLEINEEVDERFHPMKSARVAASILKENYKKFGSWTLAAAAYNAGIGYIENTIFSQKQNSYYNLILYPETARYIMRLIAFKYIYENPQKYGYQFQIQSSCQQPSLRVIKVTENIDDLADFAEKQGISYEMLIQYNPWLKSQTLTIKNGKTYEIELPYVNKKTENQDTTFVE